MPSSKAYVRNYKRERETAILRKESGCGSQSGDATRHRARRILIKELEDRDSADGMDVHHVEPIRNGGDNEIENLKLENPTPNRSHGGKIGDRSGKAMGGRIDDPAKKGRKLPK
nr:HNH endonuclease signature motif containing protein [Candidatus Sigynarchaeota archaeon]